MSYKTPSRRDARRAIGKVRKQFVALHPGKHGLKQHEIDVAMRKMVASSKP